MTGCQRTGLLCSNVHNKALQQDRLFLGLKIYNLIVVVPRR